MLRDLISERGRPPLIYTRHDGYQFTADPANLEVYETARVRVRVLLTEVRRLVTGTIAPHTVLAADDKRVRHIAVQLTAVESTLDLIT
ncbi:RacP protein [Streptomyces sp. CRN 30]|uniref:RacP protein n=1 Tax=Streptomyces sp. CRN 30 TaxID=3075613 RepID=UPI002A82AB4D|nr:RacP protein [Streptomyces sp. CRN 30]